MQTVGNTIRIASKILRMTLRIVAGVFCDSRFPCNHGRRYNPAMANLTLVYGMRLLPSDELGKIQEACIKLKNGKTAHVTMHVLEGSKEDIEKQLQASVEAFFDFYPEI